MDVEDKLCNGSEGTVKYVHIRTTIPSSASDGGTIYVQFDNEKSGDKRKDHSLGEELRECVPITVKTTSFGYVPPGKKRNLNTSIKCERKQFPLVLAHAITVHKTQGSTQDYMTGDLDVSSKNPNRDVPRNLLTGLVYTLL